jgi:hypothetical protein
MGYTGLDYEKGKNEEIGDAMNWIRDFSMQQGGIPPGRNIEDAPQSMRQELVDLFFGLAEDCNGAVSGEHIHRVVCQSLGVGAAGQPYGGHRYAAGRDIGRVDWARVYDLIARLWPIYEQAQLAEAYREGVNRILAAHGIAWDLSEDGRLHRVLPVPAQAQINAAFVELSDPRFAPALQLFNAASDAFDDRPRRERDACSNIFDAMESVAKEHYQMPRVTFGQVVAHIRQTQALNEQVTFVLEAVNTLRNRNFGHGGVIAFNLTAPEVDFTYLTCIGAILMFTRIP